jgi:tetratricopeptide (TPR) repeat protein
VDTPPDPTPPPTPVQAKLDAKFVYEIETPLGLGPFAPYQKERMAHETVFRLFWGRVIAWLIIVVVTGWLGLAGALYYFIKTKRGFDEVPFSLVLSLPWRLDEYRRAKGEYMLKRGLAAAEDQKWREAFYFLRAALPSVPEHEEARMIVARVYLMAGRPDQAQEVLVEGIPHHRARVDYLRTVLGFLFGQQADEAVVALARELADDDEGDTAFRRMVFTAEAYAHFNRNRFIEAEEVFSRAGLVGTPEARFVAARIAWERGRREVALASLRELQAQVPDDTEIHRTLVYYLNEAGRASELRRVGLAMQLARPERPEGYLDFLTGLAADGETEAVAEAEADYLGRFENNAPALLRLAERAATAGRAASVEAVLERLRAIGAKEAEPATLLLAEARLEAGDLPAVGAMPPGPETWSEASRLVLEGLRAVALLRLGRELEAEALLWRVTESRRLPAHAAVALAGRWQAAGRAEAARRLLERAVEIDPLHQPALVALLRDAVARRELEDKGELATRLATMRKPPEDLMVALAAAFGSDSFMFQADRMATIQALEARLAELRASRG